MNYNIFNAGVIIKIIKIIKMIKTIMIIIIIKIKYKTII